MTITCEHMQARLSGEACATNIRLAVQAARNMLRAHGITLIRDVALDRLVRCGRCNRCAAVLRAETGRDAQDILDELITILRGYWQRAANMELEVVDDYQVTRRRRARNYARWLASHREERREYYAAWWQRRKAARAALQESVVAANG